MDRFPDLDVEHIRWRMAICTGVVAMTLVLGALQHGVSWSPPNNGLTAANTIQVEPHR